MEDDLVTVSEPLLADPHALGMTAHPEGGWFRETWRHPRTIETDRGQRALATAITFLLRAAEASAWHRVASPELWLWQGGGPLELTLGGLGLQPVEPTPIQPTPIHSAPADSVTVQLGAGGQFLVPAGCWQRARPATDRATIVGCIVSPGFDFADFDLAELPS
jgi:predicted cupin superfamily sugar epimerase